MGGNERKIPGVRGFGEKKRTRGEEVGGLQGEAIGEALGGDKVYLTLEMMASVNCEVEPFPPKSPVMALPSAMVCVCAEQTSAFSIQTSQYQSPLRHARLTSKMAFSMLSAYSNKFMCLNIIIEDNNKAVGLANPFPAISGAEP